MFNRNALLFVAGAAIFTLDASVATAQAKKAKPQRRIPITKEAPAQPAHVDTVTVYRTDTLRTEPRVDTVRVTQTNTVTRVDTVVQTVTVLPKAIGGMYLGLGAGPNLPFGAIRTVNNPGAMGQINLGWQSVHMPLGIRLDGTYTQFSDNADYDYLAPKADMMNGNADVRLNIPIFQHLLGSAILMTPYAIGGGSYLRYRNLRMKFESETGGIGPQHAVIAGDDETPASTSFDSNWHSDWGWNLGGGLAFHAGKKEIFVESRAIHFNHGDAFGTSWSVPITFGVNFF